MPSKSLTPPRDDHEDVVPLYPSYWLVSVLKRIDPLSTIPIDGLCAVVPDGIVIAVVAATLAILPIDGDNKILFPEEDDILLSVIISLSFTFNEFVVFKIPAVVKLPLELTICKFVPIFKLAYK